MADTDDTLLDIVSFTDLIAAMDGIDEERRRLFKEVYENAVSDRKLAAALFKELSECMRSSDTNTEAGHALHGQTLSRYLERMHRSNEQLIKLAEMIADAKSDAKGVNVDDIFNSIGTASRGAAKKSR